MILVVGLFLLSISLLLARLVWTFVLATKSSAAYKRAASTSNGDEVTIGQFNLLIQELAAAKKKQRWSAVMDVLFLGLSAGAGTAASLLALNPQLIS